MTNELIFSLLEYLSSLKKKKEYILLSLLSMNIESMFFFFLNWVILEFLWGEPLAAAAT